MKHVNKPALFFICSALCTGLSCGIVKEVDLSDDGKIEVIFVTPDHTRRGDNADSVSNVNLAAATALKERYRKANPNTLLLATGALSGAAGCNEPSHQAEGNCGSNVVEAMNNAGVDIAALRRAHPALSEEELSQHIQESGFEWIAPASFQGSSNDVENRIPVPAYIIKTLRDRDGTTVRIGFLNINDLSGRQGCGDSVAIWQSAAILYNHIKNSCDAIVAITGQHFQDDSKVKEIFPGIDAIVGNHSSRPDADGMKPVAHITHLHVHKRKGTSTTTVKKKIRQYPSAL